MAAGEREPPATRLPGALGSPEPVKTVRLDARNPRDVQRAAKILREGGIVALPTETVYGLAGNALDPLVVGKIYTAKGRPSDNPLIVHVRGIAEASGLVRELPAAARELAFRFWPGPLSIVLPKSDLIPTEVTGGADTVALRAPDNAAFQEVLATAGVPLAAPSANRAGAPSPTTAQHVLADLDGRIDAVLDGGPCRVGVESTVVSLAGVNGCCAPASGPQHDDIKPASGGEKSVVEPDSGVSTLNQAQGSPGSTTRRARLLRPGGVSLEQLRAVLGEVTVDPGVTGNLDPDVVPGAPGMKYRHYAPPAPLAILTGSLPDAARYLGEYAEQHPGETTAVLCPVEEVAAFLAAARVPGSRQAIEARQVNDRGRIPSRLWPPGTQSQPLDLRVVAYGSLTSPETLAHGLFAALRELSTPEIDRIFARLPGGDDGINLATRNRLQKAAGFTEIDASAR